MVDVTRVPTITIASVPPLGPQLGDLWWSPITGQQSVYHNDGNTLQWVISNWGSGKQGPPGIPGSVFVDDVAPTNPEPGTLWWSNESGILFIWYDDGSSEQWVAIGGGGGDNAVVFIGDTPPVTPLANSLWWNTTTGSLFIYYYDGNSTQWVPASPSFSSNFGAHTATADVAITGYITIVDAYGVTRKLAVIT